MTAPELSAPVRVLVAEKIADTGVQMLRELGADVEPGSGVAAAQRAFLDAGVALAAPGA